MNAPDQLDLFRLDWLPLEEATGLCGLSAPWLADELLAGHARGISAKVNTNRADPYGLDVWMPSLGMWMESHRDLLINGFALLRNGNKAKR